MAMVVFLPQKNSLRKIILLLTSSIHVFATISLWQYPRAVRFNSFLGFDAVSQLVLNCISLLFFVVSIYLIGYLDEKKRRSNRILISCLLGLLASMTLVMMSRHMGLLWIAIASSTLLSVPLVNYYRTPKSIEATWKYLLISSVGIALGLLGTLFLAISATSINTIFLDDILNNAAYLSPSWLKLSVIFLLVGYGTKMGLAPMHTWKPDTYGEAPSPIGALMSGAVTGCAFLAVLRVFQICFYAHLKEFVSPILILLGILSLGIAAVFILGQKDFKRMLGYSSVEHMGMLVLALGLGGGAIWASLFHMVNNTFAKGLIFLVSGNLNQIFRSRKIENIQGVIHRFPITGVCLIVGLLVITGFPPFGIFYSELLILKEALITHQYMVGLFYLLFLSVIFFGYARIILSMALGQPTEGHHQRVKKENFFMVVPLIILLFILFFVGILVPDAFYNLINEAIALLGGK